MQVSKSAMKNIEFIEKLGERIELSRENKDINAIDNEIKIGSEKLESELSNYEKGIIHYFISNAYSYRKNLLYLNRNEIPLGAVELEKEICHLRIATSLINEENPFLKCQILTNLGSLFSHLGRVCEAQEYFNQCLEIEPNFGMAVGNKGYALAYYSNLIFDDDQKLIFLREAREYLLNSLNLSGIYPEARNDFLIHLKELEDYLPQEYLEANLKYEYKHENKSLEELKYRKWCSENKLFVNPLNDIFIKEIVEHDYLFTPTMTLKNGEDPIYQSIFNQIKQEYITARYFFYESLSVNEIHYADRDVTLMNTNDYSVYSIHIEKVKMTFRMCYSIFDKIAYLLNIYLNLGHSKTRVSYRNLWYQQKGKNKSIHKKIENSKNWALSSLFWLSKDFYDREFNDNIEPESKDIAIIKNFIEHKAFKIIESFNPNWTNQTETYEIDRELFYDKTFKLLKTTRAALMYLTFTLHIEEEKKEKNSNGLTLPINFLKIDDEDKY